MKAGPTQIQKRVSLAIAAAGLLLFVLVGGLAGVALQESIAELRHARDRNASTRALVTMMEGAETPAGLRHLTLMMAGKDSPEAVLAERLRRLADEAGLAVEIIPAESEESQQLAGVYVSVSGDAEAVLGWVGEVETGAPVIRFRDWQFGEADQGLTFSALAEGVVL